MSLHMLLHVLTIHAGLVHGCGQCCPVTIHCIHGDEEQRSGTFTSEYICADCHMTITCHGVVIGT